jgi:hypothetical protein
LNSRFHAGFSRRERRIADCPMFVNDFFASVFRNEAMI